MLPGLVSKGEAMAKRISEQGRPWFVRGRRGKDCYLLPAAAAGWLITLLYVVAVAGIGLVFSVFNRAGTAGLVGWGVFTAAATFIYLLTAWRTSVSITCKSADGRERSLPDVTRPSQSLLFALLTAALLIGAAALGARL